MEKPKSYRHFFPELFSIPPPYSQFLTKNARSNFPLYLIAVQLEGVAFS